MQLFQHKNILVITAFSLFISVGLIYLVAKSRETIVSPQPVSKIQGSSKCRELILNHNDLSEQRIDLVFLGFRYSSPIQLKGFAETVIDFDAQARGLFSLEPFKSNKRNSIYGTLMKLEHRKQRTFGNFPWCVARDWASIIMHSARKSRSLASECSP